MRDLTPKQAEILKLVVKANPDGAFLDIDQLIERLSYKPTKEAVQFSLRFMIRRGVIVRGELELRRGAKRRIIVPTMLGYNEYRSL